MKNIIVTLPHRGYPIHVNQGALADLGKLMRETKLAKYAVVITMASIKALHGATLMKHLRPACREILFLAVPDSEESKNAGLALKLINQIARFDGNRGVFLIAFGGGVVGDLTGFIAAVYKRGVPYVQIPTTLLAQIDSSIGGKTAVDTAFAKNLIGVFYQPQFVLADTDLLISLPPGQIRAGCAEAVKYALVEDPALFSFLENHYEKILMKNPETLKRLIVRCASIKAAIVSEDEFDKKGRRMILNFGHTVGHAVEAASNFKLSHGEAVSIGMAAACDISVGLGYLAAQTAARAVSLLEKIGLPTKARGLNLKTILDALRHDKKSKEGANRFILLEKIGKTKTGEGISEKIIRKAVRARLA